MWISKEASDQRDMTWLSVERRTKPESKYV